MHSLLNFRTVILAGTFINGAVALVYQIVWQRYMSFLVGSEARSISLVVAVFLFGLAAGYRFWGNLTERDLSRGALLKIVGLIEIGIAAYGLLFRQYFALIQELTYAGPNWLAFDLVIAALLLFLPTFLMGASIPVLTAAVPERADEVNYAHTRIYGINTLGAFAGAMIGGFYLVPAYGLPMSLIIGAIANIAVGLIFFLNPLRGQAHKAEDIPRIEHQFGAAGIYLFVFITGAVSIATEIVFMRLASLTVGSGHYIFPIIVGLVILGLAIGSLSLRRTGMTAASVPREVIRVVIVLAAVYLTVPYWGYWISHVRVSLATIPWNYGVHLGLVVLFFAMLILPVVIPMGRLLPMGYALMDKTRDDYGKQCGRVYFANTLGTVAGAVILGYIMFLLLNLPGLMKLNMGLLAALGIVLAWRSLQRGMIALFGALLLAIIVLPAWDRQLHVLGLFRVQTAQEMHGNGVFWIPKRVDRDGLLRLRDDPVATVAAFRVNTHLPQAGQSLRSMGVSVNGKTDGNTIGDYSNMMLLGMLPYLYAPKETDIRAAVVGLGTGMTSGALAAAEDVREVITLEISPAVIEVSPLFDEYTFHLSTNPKSKLVCIDAFRYFAREREKFDLIASEPTNPWIVGVENLFTPEYYTLASRSLSENGVFVQWVQMYAINQDIFSAILTNVIEEFEYAELLIVGTLDVAIVASHAPLDESHVARRLAQPHVQAVLGPMGLGDPRMLKIMTAYEYDALEAVSSMAAMRPRHSIDVPWVGHEASKAHFLGQTVGLAADVLNDIGRHLQWSAARREAVVGWVDERGGDLSHWCTATAQRHSAEFICLRVRSVVSDFANVRAVTAAAPASNSQDGSPARLNLPLAALPEVLSSYRRLREQGYLEQNLKFLARIEAALLALPGPEFPPHAHQAARQLVSEYVNEWQWDEAMRTAEALAARGLAPDDLLRTEDRTLLYRERVELYLQRRAALAR